MKTNFDFSSLGELLQGSQSLRESLAKVLSFVDKQNQKINFSEVARRSQLKSRSYVRLVFLGLKYPSADALSSILKALKIPSSCAQFILMQHRLELCADKRSREKLIQELENKRKRLMTHRKSLKSAVLFRPSYLPRLFAVLGSKSDGTSLEEIQRRTGLTSKQIEEALKYLERDGFIRIQRDPMQVFPLTSHLVWNGGNGQSFKDFYLDMVDLGRKRAVSTFLDQKQLFSATITSIKKEKMIEYAKRLWELTLEFADEIEDPDGDTVASLQVSFYAE